VLIPILSRQVSYKAAYARTYFMTITGMMVCAQPGVLFGVVFAHDVVGLLLGPKWDGVAPIFAWLGAAGLQQLVTSSTVWLFISQGRAKEYAALAVANSAVAVLSFVVGLPWGGLGVAASFTLFDFCMRMPFTWWFVTRRGPVGLAATFRIVLPHLVALGACASCLTAVSALKGHLTVADMGMGALATYILYAAILLAWSSKRESLRECALILSPLRQGLIR
jgi:PST family polysaccharide transporter